MFMMTLLCNCVVLSLSTCAKILASPRYYMHGPRRVYARPAKSVPSCYSSIPKSPNCQPRLTHNFKLRLRPRQCPQFLSTSPLPQQNRTKTPSPLFYAHPPATRSSNSKAQSTSRLPRPPPPQPSLGNLSSRSTTQTLMVKRIRNG